MLVPDPLYLDKGNMILTLILFSSGPVTGLYLPVILSTVCFHFISLREGTPVTTGGNHTSWLHCLQNYQNRKSATGTTPDTTVVC